MTVRAAVAIVALAMVSPRVAADQQASLPASVVEDLTWRPLGPFLGGRATAVAGIPSEPYVFFIGTVNGGVWKTTDAGNTWQPTFDTQPVSAIGALAVAPTDPRVVYAGTGTTPEATNAIAGDGLYRSHDGGRTWTRTGLAESQHIAQIVVHPRDSNTIFVAVLGSPYGDGDQRGVFRSLDGGRSFERVLFTGPDTGAADVLLDPRDSRVLYASLWQVRRSAADGRAFGGPSSGLYTSADGGTSWHRLPALPGLPTSFSGRISLAMAPNGEAGTLFAFASGAPGAGLFVSRNGGEAWTLVPDSVGPSAAENARVRVTTDATGQSSVVLVGRGVWRSSDLGMSFRPWRGAREDTEYDDVWINPAAPATAVLAGERGASITLNGGETWTISDGQPLGRFSHVAIDSTYPYRVCGADLAFGPGCLPLRGESGRIVRQDWQPVGPKVSGYVAPDPSDPDVVYAGGVVRYDRRNGQVQYVPPVVRTTPPVRSGPLLFAPTETRALLFADDQVWKSTTAGYSWTSISPTLTRDIPVSLPFPKITASPASSARSDISALAPSPVDAKVLWAGTTAGALHVTRDGGTTWREVTPPETPVWASVTALEASHFDSNSAYAAVDYRRLGDLAPHLLRTRDGGVTWTDITSGLPEGAVVHTIREDQLRRGLLFAGTARSVFLSFDDGDGWQPLRRNLPPTDVRDIAIRDSTLVAATDGRGLWALDDISVLRQITADITRSPAFLFRPGTAWRSSRGLVAREPDATSASNPADGVALSYLIGPSASGPVTLDIIETATGDVIRSFASADTPATLDDRPGLHHVTWDLRYSPVGGRGPMVMPGAYQVRLTTSTQRLRQAVLVRLDPRIRTPPAELAALLKLARTLNAKRADVLSALSQSPAGGRADRLRGALARLDVLFDILQQADARPTSAVDTAITAALDDATTALGTQP